MRNLVLFGFMGTGKTLISRKMKKILRLKLIDMDTLIEEREHRSINDIFKEDGEAYFREQERIVTEELAGKQGLIVSTGGGVVLNEENIVNFKRNGVCICLHAQPETIYERVKHHSHRPLLKTPDPLKTITDLLDKREPYYAKVPYHIRTDNKTPDQICTEIMEIYNNHPYCKME